MPSAPTVLFRIFVKIGTSAADLSTDTVLALRIWLEFSRLPQLAALPDNWSHDEPVLAAEYKT